MPKLTPEESRAVGGAAAEEEKRNKIISIKKARENLGIPVKKIKFKKGSLPEGTKIAEGFTDKSTREGPGKLGKRKLPPITTRKKLQEAGIREPKRGELERGIAAVKLPKKRKRSTKSSVKTYKPGQAAKLDGQVVRVSPENVEEVNKQARTKVLPIAGVEQMTQPSMGPRVPLNIPKGGLKESTYFGKGGSQRRLRGFATSADKVSFKAWEAMGHLDNMMLHQPGSAEHNKSTMNFSRVHREVFPLSRDVHTILGMGFKVVNQEKYPQQTKHLNLIKDALSERISLGRAMEKRRSEASKAGNPGKAQ